MKKMKDWRVDYVICPHIAEDKNLSARHSGFRVCCEDCYKREFLNMDINLMIDMSSGDLTIFRIK